MDSEQITVRGVIRAVDGDEAVIEVENAGCGRCHEEGGCGGQQLTQMFCSGPKSYRVENSIGAAINDQVVIAIAPGSVRRIANFAYILPLTVTITGALLGSLFGEDLGSMLGAGCGLIVSFLYLRLHARNHTGNPSIRPHIISRS